MKKIIKIIPILFLLLAGTYFISKKIFYSYFWKAGTELAELEKSGRLSRNFGAVWKEINRQKRIDNINSRARFSEEKGRILYRKTPEPEEKQETALTQTDTVNYPSLMAVGELNQLGEFRKKISVTDRINKTLAEIVTTHNCAEISEFPEALKSAVILSEDKNFYNSKTGLEFNSYIRAILKWIWKKVRFKSARIGGVSTIPQQVSRLLLSKYDSRGYRFVERSLNRKLREMKIACALKQLYTDDEILQVYLNHCVTAEKSLTGYKDIAEHLFGKKLDQLSDAECIYLSRIVKWNRNIPSKIKKQTTVDLPRIAAELGWDKEKQNKVLEEIKDLEFNEFNVIKTSHHHIIDLANEYWLQICGKNGMKNTELSEMNLLAPESLIRRKGDLTISLHIDSDLQNEIEELVDKRGYGNDTLIRTDVRAGSFGEFIGGKRLPPDTVDLISTAKSDTFFTEPGSVIRTKVNKGDTLIKNIRYSKRSGKIRRSVFIYKRGILKVNGQYFAYAVIDAETGRILAYYSRDRIGSSLSCLNRYPLPNGSSTAKPILHALAMDLGIYKPSTLICDSNEVACPAPWQRSFLKDKNGHIYGMQYSNTGNKKPYKVANHDRKFQGWDYPYKHLAESNNIVAVETVYRLNDTVFNNKCEINEGAGALSGYFYRLGILEKMREKFCGEEITGVRIYKELARISGADADSLTYNHRRYPFGDKLYSVALGTLELTLLQQAHLFNIFYEGRLINNPEEHPSLFIKNAVFNGDTVRFNDPLKSVKPFSNIQNIRPALLGMHKRLTSNTYDRLGKFDMPFPKHARAEDIKLSNYAKSGTTDDIIRPYNADSRSGEKTNYGLWNATIRVYLPADSGKPRDITVACVGECNLKNTGPRDGKTLHKFITKALLEKYGRPSPDGFYTQYEKHIKLLPTDTLSYCPEKKKEKTKGIMELFRNFF
ncbi:MAG: transglycosylase domain-containing protein [Fibrobacterota bacterium]